MYKIIRKKIRLDEIRNYDTFNMHGSDGYNIESLKESIRDNGWQPNFGDLPYHGDTCSFSECFFLRTNEDGLYSLPNGTHRLVALKELGVKEFDAYILEVNPKSSYTKDYMRDRVSSIERELKSNGKGMFQSFEFPYGIRLNSRDDSEKIFHSTEWDCQYYVGKDVLDIACNSGYFALQAKINGANRVIGFDVDHYMIKLGNKFKDLMELDVELKQCEFWEFDWEQDAYDIVFGNQFIYHVANDSAGYLGAKPSSYIPKALDLMANSTRNHLVMFTFVDFTDPNFEDFSDGYRPGYKKLERDLMERGFIEVRIYHREGGKRTVVASKKPWEFVWSPDKDSEYLVYKSPNINYNGLKFWGDINKKELLKCYGEYNE